MVCPRCGRDMRAQSFGTVEVDVCVSRCGGTWFDAKELGKLDEPEEGIGEALDAALARPAGERRTSPLRCTKCDAAMRAHGYQHVPGALVDECYACGGFFLDAGELRAIRDWIGEQRQKKQDVEVLLARDPVYQAERAAMEVERKRTQDVATLSKALLRRPTFFQWIALRILTRILTRSTVDDLFDA